MKPPKTYTTRENTFYSLVVLSALSFFALALMGLYKLSAILLGFNDIIDLP